jgi:hypothetical protein
MSLELLLGPRRYVSSDTEVRPSPGKGRGLFAKTMITAGTKITQEPPILEEDPKTATAVKIYESFLTMTKSNQEEFLKLKHANNDDPDNYMKGIIRELAPLGRTTKYKLNEAKRVVAIFRGNLFKIDVANASARDMLFVKSSIINRAYHSSEKPLLYIPDTDEARFLLSKCITPLGLSDFVRQSTCNS